MLEPSGRRRLLLLLLALRGRLGERRLAGARRGRSPPFPGASPPSEETLQALLSSPPFCQRRPERFGQALAGWLPAAAESLRPATVALVAQYAARHRLRQPALLDAIAAFLLPRARQLDSKVIQKLVFPFSRTNYLPSNHLQLFPQLESALLEKSAATSPLATVNILMSLFQLRHFPVALLPRVFSPGFLDNVTSSQCGPIIRRYLSLLDVAVALEVPEYDGPRLDPRFRVCMFDGALTADKANCKYSYKGLVAEALRQLVGEEGFWQDAVLPPGYCADFLLQISPSGSVLPRSSQAVTPLEALDTLNVSLSRQQWRGSLFLPEGAPHPQASQGSGCHPGEEPCAPPTTGCFLARPQWPMAESATRSPTLGTDPQQRLPKEGQPLLPASPRAAPDETPAAEEIHRVVLSVNDKWHYCQSSAVLVGSRAMRDRHLRLLGYHLVQLPYMDLEQVSGMEGAKQYLSQKLRHLRGQA